MIGYLNCVYVCVIFVIFKEYLLVFSWFLGGKRCIENECFVLKYVLFV